MKVVNLTPHDVTVVGADGSSIVFPKSGSTIRVNEASTPMGDINGIPVVAKSFGVPQIVGDASIIDSADAVIVSAIAAQALAVNPLWNDKLVVVPNDPVRDSNGVIIGCRSFAVI